MMKKKELSEMYYETLVKFYPFWHVKGNEELRANAKSSWEKLVNRGYMTQEEAERMPYILRERLDLIGKVLGRDVVEDLEKYRKHPNLFKL